MFSPSIEDRVKRIEEMIDYRRAQVTPTIKCSSCGVYIFLDTTVYSDIENVDVRCKACKALYTISMKDGHLTQLRAKQ